MPNKNIEMFRIAFVGACGALVWFLRRHFSGAFCKNDVNLRGKTALITGGNTGLGKATALALAQRGARVILACRSLKRGDKAASEIRSQVKNANIAVYFLDLSSLKSVRKFAQDFSRAESELHILVNNAGIYGCPHWKSEDGYEMQFAVNHLGHFLLTNLLLDTLAMSAPSRIIVVSSALHKNARIPFDDLNGDKDYHPKKAYGQSKLATLLFAHELNKRLPSGVTVNSVHPGIVWTELARYSSFNPILRYLAYPFLLLILKTPWQGAQTTIYCATEPSLQEVSGLYFGECEPQECAPHARDDGIAKKLWDVSERMTGLREK
ncbi:retinol dehydrogenase 12-like [Dendronephthya gigantea]|uniref:retinol dehydrogenase 12-like n=1 Tax=Dendronephthya gigantea TaxID=151771 RepID=UPI00106CDBBA|nr:retinol dehydrogenase 12-like [Dendronephthya gigantea]